jgi:hypothetical protein
MLDYLGFYLWLASVLAHIYMLHRDVGLLIEPFSWMALESLDCAIVGPNSGEFDVGAEVISAFHAEETLFTGFLRLDPHSVSCRIVSTGVG